MHHDELSHQRFRGKTNEVTKFVVKILIEAKLGRDNPLFPKWMLSPHFTLNGRGLISLAWKRERKGGSSGLPR